MGSKALEAISGLIVFAESAGFGDRALDRQSNEVRFKVDPESRLEAFGAAKLL